MCTSTYSVRLRSKFVEGLKLDENTKLKNLLTNILVNFTDNTPGEAFKVVFELLYGDKTTREATLRSYGFTSQINTELDYYSLTAEQITLLGNEFRFQYSQSCPEFLSINDDPRYQNELDNLKKIMSNHPVLLFRAVVTCKQACNLGMISYCLEPLMSDDVNSQIYGLRKMGHNSQYQKLLLPYAKAIGQLAQSMYNAWDEKPKAVHAHTCKEPTFDDKQKHSNQQLEAESSKQTSPYYTLSDEIAGIISHKADLIQHIPSSDELWEHLKQLRSFGIDLNHLVDYENLIWSIIEAHNALDAADANLSNAKLEYDKAKADFSLEDLAKIETLYNTRKSYEEAEALHEEALQNFIKCCSAYDNI